jgi:hypothetical protein
VGVGNTDDLDGSLNECRLTQAGWFSAAGDRIEAEDGGLGLPRPQAPKAEGEYMTIYGFRHQPNDLENG